MPYTGASDPGLPANVKKMGDKDKAQWVAVFNSSHKKCVDDGGDSKECEASAFAQANGVIKKGGRMAPVQELWESVKRLFEPHLQAATFPERTEYLPTQSRSFVITRQADGKARWLMIAASATINKANSIDSTILFDNFIKHARETKEYPILDFLHEEDALRFGVADWLQRDGALYLASGTFDDTDLGRAAAAGLEADPEYWGASISYRITEPPMMLLSEGQIPVYTNGVNRYISIVPKRMAANLFTAVSVTEEVMRMDKRAFDELVKLVGAEKAGAFAALVDDASRTIEEVGLVTRAEETTTPPAAVEIVAVTETAQVTETPPLPPVIEERADEPWKAELSALAERLSKLEKLLVDDEEEKKTKRATEERAVKDLDEIKSNLAGVTVLAARWQQWLDDAPEHIRGAEHVVRARDTEPVAMTLAQIEAQSLSKMNRGPHTRRPQQEV